MTQKFSIYIFICVLLCSSCMNNIGCKKISISQDEKRWLDFYQIGDSIFYKSNLGNIDTFLVKDVNDYFYTSCNKFELGENQYESNGVTLKCLNVLKRENFNQEVWFNFKKNVNNISDSTSFKYFNVFDYKTETFSDFNEIEKSVINLTTTGKEYDAYFFDRSGRHSNEDGTAVVIKLFYWSKEHGLLKYETANGEIFEFFRKG